MTIEELLTIHITRLRETAEMDNLPEGDLGWRHSMIAEADTLERLLEAAEGEE